MKIVSLFRGFILASLATHGSGQLADLLQCATIGGVEGAGCAEIQSLGAAEAVVWLVYRMFFS